jgi:Ser/Thr protein kinase RdoA (MazF antagonist)
MTSAPELARILTEYGYSERATLTPLAGGLINQTLLVEEAGRKTVLQRLNPLFRGEVHLDIEPITAHLERKGVRTPRLIPTTIGELWTTDPQGSVYRMMTFLEGHTVQRIERPETAHAAGAFVARFHVAVSDLDHTFHFTRPGAHDTQAHLRQLDKALREHAAHPAFAEVEPIADAILQQARKLEPLPTGPKRVVHGDLKVSNLLFDEAAESALALLDLDTMAHMTLPIELGDALRSWCNPRGEDAESAALDAALFEAALRGYASGAKQLLTRTEVEALVLGTLTIALELAARFCADALHERYFGWDVTRYASRSVHNRVRAQSQLAVAKSLEAQRAPLERLVGELFA